MSFQIQKKSIRRNIWVVPGRFDDVTSPYSSSVAELRQQIADAADRRTLDFVAHYRIVTDRGDPVERWSVRPGKARRLLRRY